MDDDLDIVDGEDRSLKRQVTVKQSMAPIQELLYFKDESQWVILERELELTKTLDNAYFLDASFLKALSLLNLWIGNSGAFFMPKRELRHRHYIFSLFWQPSAPNNERNNYVIPSKLKGLLRWYLTRDNFIKYVQHLFSNRTKSRSSDCKARITPYRHLDRIWSYTLGA